MTTADISELRRIAEGREAEIFAYGDGRVLRLFREAAAGAWMHREIAAMEAVRTVVPLVPETFGTVEIDGRPGIVMQRIDGPDLLTRIASRPWTVWSAGRMLGDVHAQLHEVVAPAEIESLKEAGKRRVPQSPLVPPEIAEWGLAAIDKMPEGDRLLHGDFHPANILLASTGPIVIDWPNVTRGDPDADVARSLLMLDIGEVPPGSPIVVRYGEKVARGFLKSAYLRAYRRRRLIDDESIARWYPLRAVDRLTENIVEERARLLAIIEHAMHPG
jgi:aminoglycoside phosphotransferase (APT) family kinase protein